MSIAEFNINNYLGVHDWAIDEKSFVKLSSQLELFLPAIRASITEHLEGNSLSAFGNIPKPSYIEKLSETSARLNITGTIFYPESPIDELMSVFFGGTSTSQLQADIKSLMADEKIQDIAVYVDSGGGHVAGNNTTAELLGQLAQTKNVVGYAGNYCCSAAYHLMSQVPKIYTSKESLLGSIGVVASWVDVTDFYGKMGIHFEQVTSANAPLKRLSPKIKGHREAFAEPINQLEAVMIDTIAEGRNVTSDFVKKNFGRGNIMSGEAAVKAGMADGIKSLERVLAEINNGEKAGKPANQKTALKAETIKGENTMSEKKGFWAWISGDKADIDTAQIEAPPISVSADNEKLQAETNKRMQIEAENERLKAQLAQAEAAKAQAEAEKMASAKESLGSRVAEIVKAGAMTPAQGEKALAHAEVLLELDAKNVTGDNSSLVEGYLSVFEAKSSTLLDSAILGGKKLNVQEKPDAGEHKGFTAEEKETELIGAFQIEEDKK